MAGLLDDMFGSGDPNAKDDVGMTRQERAQPGWDALIKAGLLAVAGGQNLMPNERARYIAAAGGALGDATTEQMQLRSQYAQQMLRQQQIQASKMQLAQQQQWQQLAKDPAVQQELAGLPPASRQGAILALGKGDMGAYHQIISDAKPKVATDSLGRTTVTYPDGSVSQSDSTGRSRWIYKAPGSQMPDTPPGATQGSGPGNFDASLPNVGGTDRLNLTPLQNVPHDVAVRALRVARGEEKPPTTRSDPNAQLINSLAAQVAGANGTSYQTRQKYEDSLIGERGIVSTVSRATQHEGTAIDLYNSIGNLDGGTGAKYMNMARNKLQALNNPELLQKYTAARIAMVNAITEAKNAIAGARGTGVVEREEIEKSIDPNMSISEMKGLMQAIHSQMMEALTSVAYRGSQVRHAEVTPEALVGPDVWKHHQNIEKFYTAPPSSGGGKPAAQPDKGGDANKPVRKYNPTTGTLE